MFTHQFPRNKIGLGLLPLAAFVALPAFCSQAYVSLCCAPAGSISSFSPGTNQLAGTFFTLPGAIDMVLSPDGTRAYVATSSVGQNDVPAGGMNGLSVYQLPAGKLIRSIALPVSPTEIVIDPAGTHVYAAAVDPTSGAHRVISIDLTSGQVAVAPLPNTTGFDLLPIAVSPDGATLYVGSATQRALTVLNAATLAQTGAIALTGTTGPAPPAITPDGKKLCAIVSGASGAALDIVNLTTKKATEVPLASAAFPFGVVLSLNGKTAYVNGSDVFAVDLATASVVGSAPTGMQDPYRIAITPDGTSLYAASVDGKTAVVSTSLTITGVLETLAGAYQIAFAPQGRGYVLNENGSAVVLVDTATMKASRFVAVGDHPTRVAVSPNGAEAFVLNTGSETLAAIGQPASATAAIPIPISGGPLDMAFLHNGLYVLSIVGLHGVNPATLQVSPLIPVPLPNQFSGLNGTIAASPVASDLFLPYFMIDEEGVTGGGLALYNTQTAATPVIGSSLAVPGALVASPDGSHVYAAATILSIPPADTLLDFDITSQTLANTSTPGAVNYVAVAISQDGSTLYCVDSGGKVDLVSTSSLQVITSIPVSVQPSGIAVSADGTQALVTDSTATSVTVLDLTSDRVAGTIMVGAPSVGAAYLN